MMKASSIKINPMRIKLIIHLVDMCYCNILFSDSQPGTTSTINAFNDQKAPEKLTWNLNYDLFDRIELAISNIDA